MVSCAIDIIEELAVFADTIHDGLCMRCDLEWGDGQVGYAKVLVPYTFSFGSTTPFFSRGSMLQVPHAWKHVLL